MNEIETNWMCSFGAVLDRALTVEVFGSTLYLAEKTNQSAVRREAPNR